MIATQKSKGIWEAEEINLTLKICLLYTPKWAVWVPHLSFSAGQWLKQEDVFTLLPGQAERKELAQPSQEGFQKLVSYPVIRSLKQTSPCAAQPAEHGLVSRCLAPAGWGLCSSLGYSSEVRKPDIAWPLLPSWLSSSHPLIINLIKAATLQESQILVVDDCCDSFGPGFACEWHGVIECLQQTGSGVLGWRKNTGLILSSGYTSFPLLPQSLILPAIWTQVFFHCLCYRTVAVC